MARVVVRWHPHRANFGDNTLPKNYVHVSSWGTEPRAFFEVTFYVPVRSVYGAGCGCLTHTAQAWAEAEVDERDISWTDRAIVIGKKSRAVIKKRKT